MLEALADALRVFPTLFARRRFSRPSPTRRCRSRRATSESRLEEDLQSSVIEGLEEVLMNLRLRHHVVTIAIDQLDGV